MHLEHPSRFPHCLTAVTGTFNVEMSRLPRSSDIARCRLTAAIDFKCRRIWKPPDGGTWSPAVGEGKLKERQTYSAAFGGTGRHPQYGRNSSSRKRAGICTPPKIVPSRFERRR